MFPKVQAQQQGTLKSASGANNAVVQLQGAALGKPLWAPSAQSGKRG